jgi:hypothetical protein
MTTEIDCDQFPGRLKEICDGTAVKSDGRPFSRRERRSILSKRLNLKLENGSIEDTDDPSVSGIGTRLHKIIIRETGNSIPCSECLNEIKALNQKTALEVLRDAIPLAERITSRASSKAQKWYQRLAATYLPGFVQATVREWIVEACGVPMPKAIATPARPLDVVCGCVHDGTARQFIEHITHKIPGVKLGNVTGVNSHRRIVATQGHVDELKAEIIEWNGGTEVPSTTTPWMPGTWMYAVTTVASRRDSTLPETLLSLRQAGFDTPILFVDGPENEMFWRFGLEIVNRSTNLRSFANWHLTLLELYSRNPWANFYAIFQDDFVCCPNLKEYLTKCQYPEKGYLNLLTFMENEVIVSGNEHLGWHEATKGRSGRQKGRGAVALVFDHQAVEALLSNGYLVTRTRDSARGHKAIDGAVVECMNNAGWTEYVHNPSLIQHIGIESSMGNKRHPVAHSFDKNFDPLTLLVTDTPCQSTQPDQPVESVVVTS